MKKIPGTLLIVIASYSIYSCSTNSKALTTEAAANKIAYSLDSMYAPLFHINKHVSRARLPDNIKAMKAVGFIDLLPIDDNDGMLEIKVLDKAQPYFVKEEFDELQFTPGLMDIEVVSIRQKGKNRQGKPVYLVRYKEQVVKSEFIKAWKPRALKPGIVYNGEATFVADGNNWKIIEWDL